MADLTTIILISILIMLLIAIHRLFKLFNVLADKAFKGKEEIFVISFFIMTFVLYSYLDLAFFNYVSMTKTSFFAVLFTIIYLEWKKVI